MIAKYVQLGGAVDYRPIDKVSAGDVVIQGELVGVARLDILANTLGALAVGGVFDIEKEATEVISAGSLIYWDKTNKQATSTATDNHYLGKSIKDAETGEFYVRVLLNAPHVAITTTSPTG